MNFISDFIKFNTFRLLCNLVNPPTFAT